MKVSFQIDYSQRLQFGRTPKGQRRLKSVYFIRPHCAKFL